MQVAYEFHDTIAALSTPPGVGALGVIRISGPDALDMADRIFRGKKLSDQPARTVHFGTLNDESDRVIDEVVATIFRGPRSFSGEDTVEFSCHGSPYILQEVLALLVRQGVRLARPGEFTQRAFLHGKMDLAQAEAVADLIAASHQSAHDLAMRQMRGGVSRRIADLRDRLVHFASLIELELDFSEEDVEFADRRQLRDLMKEILASIRSLGESFSLGNALKEGVLTVIAGRPNAGKSTLLNALLEEDRAIVSDIPGTTRDSIEEVLNIGGIRFRLVDTAGIREAQDTIEALGVERTLARIGEAAVLVYVFDVRTMTPEEVAADAGRLSREGLEVLLVANKMDLNPYLDPNSFALPGMAADRVVPVSARHQMNVALLKERLYGLALSGTRADADTLVSSARHAEALYRAGQALEQALKGLDEGLPGDLLAEDIRQTLHHLGEITGAVTTDDLLENIFRKFCIGK